MVWQFEFLAPQYLALMLAPLLLLGFLIWRNRIRIARLKLLRFPTTKRSFLIFGSALIAALLSLSLARPSRGFREMEISSAGRDVMAVVDVSTSMLAKDVSPNRVEFAKRKLLDIVTYLENHSRGDRLGLVLFAGDAYLFCPLTSDYSVLRVFIGSIGPDLITSGGSALNKAIQTAITSFKVSEASSPRLLLITDGEDQELDVSGIISLAKSAPISIDTLGIGTTDGSPIESNPGYFVKDRSGNVVISRLNLVGLTDIASQTGGHYLTAAVNDNDISTILAKRGGETRSGVEKIRVYDEVGPLLALVALCVTVFLALRSKVIFATFLLFIMVPPQARAQAAPAKNQEAISPSSVRSDSSYSAAKAYQDGNYDEAAAGFAQQHRMNPADDLITFGLANSLYKLGKFDEAAKLFGQLKTGANTGRGKFRATYNLGNARLQSKDYKGAIKEYEESLNIKPEDAGAKHNLDLAKKLLEQQEQEQEKKKDEKKEQNQNKDDQQKQDQKDEDNGGKQDKDKQNEEQQNKDQQDGDSKEQDKQGGQDKDKEQSNGQKQQENEQDQGKEPDKDKDTGNDGEKVKNGGDSDKEKDDENNKDNEERRSNQAQGQQSYDASNLKEREARAWLESLSDSPVLLQKKVGNPRNSRQQTW